MKCPQLKKSKKNYLKLLFGLSTSILTLPLIVLSCSNDNIKPDNPNEPSLTTKFSKHTLSYQSMINAKSPLDIISSADVFKKSVENIEKKLKTENIDFMGNYDPQLFKDFAKLNQEVGIFNEYGENIYEKMKYAMKDIYVDFDMKQKYLEEFGRDEEFGSSTLNNVNIINKLNELISKNQFGYLPSNLSQFLYYCKLDDLSNIFEIKNVKEIKMNFDDEKGSFEILIVDKNINKYLLKLNTQNLDSLRKNEDFRKYIYDRSFVISFPRLVYTEQVLNQISRVRTQYLRKYQLQGTGWIFDRIIDDNIPKGEYEFLVGTNMHVVDVSKAFNKDRYWATGTSDDRATEIVVPNLSEMYKVYNEHWDGGFWNLQGINNDNIAGNDEFQTYDWPNNKNNKYQKIIQRKPDVKNSVVIRKNKSIDEDIDTKDDATTQLNNSNIVDDLIWYTPNFITQGTYTDRGNKTPTFDLKDGYNRDNFFEEENVDGFLKDKWYENYNGYRTGKISNAGADFVITKIRLKENDVKTLFPTLYKVLNTPEEKDWYIGLGIDNNPTELSANSTLFAGGYPEGNWKSLKSNSGKIYSQQRYISREKLGNYQTYWTKYDDSENAKYNEFRGLVDWYKNNQFKSPSMSQEQNSKYLPKGMQIQKVLQQSFITFSDQGKHSENDILKGGASGSMIINSRFELCGLLYLGNWKVGDDLQPDQNTFINIGVLFKNYTQENKNLNIIQQVKDKLIKENKTTLKLNPKK